MCYLPFLHFLDLEIGRIDIFEDRLIEGFKIGGFGGLGNYGIIKLVTFLRGFGGSIVAER